MTTNNNQENSTLTLAQSITPDGQGVVTASLLYDYMEHYMPNRAMAVSTQEAIDWDVPSINIRCNGKNVIQVNNDGIVMGNSEKDMYLNGVGIEIPARSPNMFIDEQLLIVAQDTIIQSTCSLYLFGKEKTLLGGNSTVQIYSGTNCEPSGSMLASAIMTLSGVGGISLQGQKILSMDTREINMSGHTSVSLIDQRATDLRLFGENVSLDENLISATFNSNIELQAGIIRAEASNIAVSSMQVGMAATGIEIGSRVLERRLSEI